MDEMYRGTSFAGLPLFVDLANISGNSANGTILIPQRTRVGRFPYPAVPYNGSSGISGGIFYSLYAIRALL